MVDINTAFKELSEEAQDLYLPSRIRELEASPSPLVFLREYVMLNIPVIIRGGVQQWPALLNWSDDYLIKILGKGDSFIREEKITNTSKHILFQAGKKN